jgi:hypothetical protein
VAAAIVADVVPEAALTPADPLAAPPPAAGTATATTAASRAAGFPSHPYMTLTHPFLEVDPLASSPSRAPPSAGL